MPPLRRGNPFDGVPELYFEGRAAAVRERSCGFVRAGEEEPLFRRGRDVDRDDFIVVVRDRKVQMRVNEVPTLPSSVSDETRVVLVLAHERPCRESV